MIYLNGTNGKTVVIEARASEHGCLFHVDSPRMGGSDLRGILNDLEGYGYSWAQIEIVGGDPLPCFNYEIHKSLGNVRIDYAGGKLAVVGDVRSKSIKSHILLNIWDRWNNGLKDEPQAIIENVIQWITVL